MSRAPRRVTGPVRGDVTSARPCSFQLTVAATRSASPRGSDSSRYIRTGQDGVTTKQQQQQPHKIKTDSPSPSLSASVGSWSGADPAGLFLLLGCASETLRRTARSNGRLLSRAAFPGNLCVLLRARRSPSSPRCPMSAHHLTPRPPSLASFPATLVVDLPDGAEESWAPGSNLMDKMELRATE